MGHHGGSWGFRTPLVRFVEAGLSIAISCNADSAALCIETLCVNGQLVFEGGQITGNRPGRPILRTSP